MIVYRVDQKDTEDFALVEVGASQETSIYDLRDAMADGREVEFPVIGNRELVGYRRHLVGTVVSRKAKRFTLKVATADIQPF